MQNWADYQANGLGADDVPIPSGSSGVTPTAVSKPMGGTPALTAFGGVVLFLVVTYLFFSPINT